MATVLDKEIVKEALRELIYEDKSLFRDLLKDVFNIKNTVDDDEFNELLKKNFMRFDETFRALS